MAVFIWIKIQWVCEFLFPVARRAVGSPPMYCLSSHQHSQLQWCCMKTILKDEMMCLMAIKSLCVSLPDLLLKLSVHSARLPDSLSPLPFWIICLFAFAGRVCVYMCECLLSWEVQYLNGRSVEHVVKLTVWHATEIFAWWIRCVCLCVWERERRECLSGRVQVSWDNFVVDDSCYAYTFRVSSSLFQLFQPEKHCMCMCLSGFTIFLGTRCPS